MLRLGRENNFSLLSLISSSLISSSMHEWMMVVVWVKDKNIYNLSKKKLVTVPTHSHLNYEYLILLILNDMTHYSWRWSLL